MPLTAYKLPDTATESTDETDSTTDPEQETETSSETEETETSTETETESESTDDGGDGGDGDETDTEAEELSTKYDIDDIVDINNGEAKGTIEAVYTKSFELPDGGTVDASGDSPVYEVLLDAGGRSFFRGGVFDKIPEED